MSVDIDALGAGSIVETEGGRLYTKDRWGDWWKLSIAMGSSPFKKLDYLKTGRVLREAKHSFLEDFPVGSVITFDKGDVAVRHREDFWEVAGSSREYTSEQLETFIFDKSSVKVLS